MIRNLPSGGPSVDVAKRTVRIERGDHTIGQWREQGVDYPGITRKARTSPLPSSLPRPDIFTINLGLVMVMVDPPSNQDHQI